MYHYHNLSVTPVVVILVAMTFILRCSVSKPSGFSVNKMALPQNKLWLANMGLVLSGMIRYDQVNAFGLRRFRGAECLVHSDLTSEVWEQHDIIKTWIFREVHRLELQLNTSTGIEGQLLNQLSAKPTKAIGLTTATRRPFGSSVVIEAYVAARQMEVSFRLDQNVLFLCCQRQEFILGRDVLAQFPRNPRRVHDRPLGCRWRQWRMSIVFEILAMQLYSAWKSFPFRCGTHTTLWTCGTRMCTSVYSISIFSVNHSFGIDGPNSLITFHHIMHEIPGHGCSLQGNKISSSILWIHWIFDQSPGDLFIRGGCWINQVVITLSLRINWKHFGVVRRSCQRSRDWYGSLAGVPNPRLINAMSMFMSCKCSWENLLESARVVNITIKLHNKCGYCCDVAIWHTSQVRGNLRVIAQPRDVI